MKVSGVTVDSRSCVGVKMRCNRGVARTKDPLERVSCVEMHVQSVRE